MWNGSGSYYHYFSSMCQFRIEAAVELPGLTEGSVNKANKSEVRKHFADGIIDERFPSTFFLFVICRIQKISYKSCYSPSALTDKHLCTKLELPT